MTGDELRGALKQLNLTNLKFGNMVGAHEQTVSKWICGRYPVPQHIELIARLMGAQVPSALISRRA